TRPHFARNEIRGEGVKEVMGAGKLLRLTAFVAATFAAGLGTRMALAAVLLSPALPAPTASVTVPPLPTVMKPPLPTTSTPTQPPRPGPPKPPAPPTTTSTASGGTSTTPSHSGGGSAGPVPSSGPTASASSPASSQRSAAHAPAPIARRAPNGQGPTLGGDTGGAQHLGSAEQPKGNVPGANHKEATDFTPAAVAGRVSNPFVIAALAAAVLLLGTAALPRGVVPSPRLMFALIEHRTAIAAAGTAALCSAIVALVLA